MHKNFSTVSKYECAGTQHKSRKNIHDMFAGEIKEYSHCVSDVYQLDCSVTLE